MVKVILFTYICIDAALTETCTLRWKSLTEIFVHSTGYWHILKKPILYSSLHGFKNLYKKVRETRKLDKSVKTRQKLEFEKTRVFAPKTWLKMPFKNFHLRSLMPFLLKQLHSSFPRQLTKQASTFHREKREYFKGHGDIASWLCLLAEGDEWSSAAKTTEFFILQWCPL